MTLIKKIIAITMMTILVVSIYPVTTSPVNKEDSFREKKSKISLDLESLIQDLRTGKIDSSSAESIFGEDILEYIKYIEEIEKKMDRVGKLFDIRVKREWNGYIYYPFKPMLIEGELEEGWKKAVLTQEMLLKAYNSQEKESSSGYAELIPKPVNSTGNLTFVAILIEFQDIKFKNNHDTSYFNNILNNDTEPSLKTYYLENSYGLLNLTIDVYGPFTSSKDLAYYGEDGSGIDNLNGPIYELTKEAINLADPYVDFSKYDNNGDGYVDAVLVIHAGTGQEWSGNSSDIWSHRWSVYPPVSVDGVYVKDYSMQPEHYPRRSPTSTEASILGVLAHEFGHILGLPDFYDVDDTSEGIGNWGLMGGGGWTGVSIPGDNPAHLCAWSKIFLGYKKPIPLSPQITKLISLDPVETTGDIIKLPIPNHPGEYFLLEYRSTSSGAMFDRGIPGSGLLIWHIDEGVAFMDWDNDGWNNWEDNDVNMNESHYMVDVEEFDNYDGTQELEDNVNRGEASDVWTSTNLGFNDYTDPAATSYDGSYSGLSVSQISSASSQISFVISAKTIELREDLEIYNSTMTMKSNLTIINNSSLRIVNSVLEIDPSSDNEFNIFVTNGSLILENTSVYSTNPLMAFSIIVNSTSQIYVVNSTIANSDFGDPNPADSSGIIGLSKSAIEIINSTLTNMSFALTIKNASKLEINNSKIQNNGYGVVELYCNSSKIINTLFQNNTFGLYLGFSKNANIENNAFIGDNPVMWGSDIDHFIHNLNNNTVNGKKIHYILSMSHVVVPNDGGPVIVVDSFNVSLSNVVIRDMDVGIQFAFSRLLSINNIIINKTTIGITYLNSIISDAEKVKVSASEKGILLLNSTSIKIKKSTISDNNGNGIEVDGGSQDIMIKFSNIYNNTGFGLINYANDSGNATLNWWGDANGPEYKSTPDTLDPEELWGNITYDPWLTSPSEDEYLHIVTTNYPNKVLTSSNFSINVTVSYKFNSSTPIRIELFSTDDKVKVSDFNDTVIGNGTKQYNFTATAKFKRTTMNFEIRVYYNTTLIGWIKSDTESISIKVLPPEPTVTITDPSDGDKINGKKVKVYWSIQEGYYSITSVEIRLNLNSWIDVTGKTHHTLTNLVNGTNTITIRVNDSAGHTVTDSVTITSIQKAPKIEITSPLNNTTTIERNITVKWNITLGTFPISKIEIRLDNGTWIDVTGKTNHTFTNLTIGKHNITVRVIDTEGLSDTSTIFIEIVKPKPPSIEITYPSNGTIIDKNNITIKWTVTKGDYKISKVEIKLDNGTWIDVTNKNSYTFTNLSEGTHTATLRVIDTAGNMDQSTTTFQVKTQEPTGEEEEDEELPLPTIPGVPLPIIIIGTLSILIIILMARRRK